MIFENILWVVLAHYVADYPLQGNFLANTKATHWYSLLAHSVIYALAIALCYKLIGAFALWKVLVLLASHIGVDYVKSHAKDKSKALTSYLYWDQVLHLGIAIALLFV